MNSQIPNERECAMSEYYEERAAIREYEGLMTRKEAERLAKMDVIEYQQEKNSKKV